MRPIGMMFLLMIFFFCFRECNGDHVTSMEARVSHMPGYQQRISTGVLFLLYSYRFGESSLERVQSRQHGSRLDCIYAFMARTRIPPVTFKDSAAASWPEIWTVYLYINEEKSQATLHVRGCAPLPVNTPCFVLCPQCLIDLYTPWISIRSGEAPQGRFLALTWVKSWVLGPAFKWLAPQEAFNLSLAYHTMSWIYLARDQCYQSFVEYFTPGLTRYHDYPWFCLDVRQLAWIHGCPPSKLWT